MSEKPDPRARLVAEAFHPDWESGSPARLARAAAAHARRRCAFRRGLATGGSAALVIFGMLAFFRWRSPPPPEFRATPRPSVAAVPIAVSTVTPAFEIISEAQLFAELRGRPLLILPREDSSQHIVILDR